MGKNLSKLEVILIVLLVLSVCICIGLIAGIIVVQNNSKGVTATDLPQTSQSPTTTTKPTTTTTSTTATTTRKPSPTTPDPFPDSYRIGVGRADCTGSLSEIPMMGYAKSGQIASGLHLRQYSRAFIIAEPDDSKRVVYVSANIGMMSQRVRLEVMEQLKAKYGNLYRPDNVILSASNTHSGPAGYFQYNIFVLASNGFDRPQTNAIVKGIVTSIDRAHQNMKRGRIFVNKGTVENSQINRSPSSYLLNPESERLRYSSNTDKDLVILKMVDMYGQDMGMISWFAVHAVSMANTNKLISSDNLGYASYLFEQEKNSGSLPGKGSFVAAFSPSNLGDVSPNTMGPHCGNTNETCDNPTSTCQVGGSAACMALGPGKDMFESTKIIGEQIFLKAKELYDNASNELDKKVSFAHQWVDMSNVTLMLNDTHTVKTCKPALGYSFAAGTIDGAGSINFTQGTLEGDLYWDAIRDAYLGAPSKETQECHKPKPILINTGEMVKPIPWHPTIVDVQMFTVGSIALLALPAEFTTMAGRRLREEVKKILDPSETLNTEVVLAGLCNVYTHYVTTYEEYQAQRYEAASTIYGPHTLSAYLQLFGSLAKAIVQNTTNELPIGPHPPLISENLLPNNLPPVPPDNTPTNKNFGDVLVDVNPRYRPGDVVSVTFVAANPRSGIDKMLDSSYVIVRKNRSRAILYNDASWETRYYWHKGPDNQSNGTAEWHIPLSTQPGIYYIEAYGYYQPRSSFPVPQVYIGSSELFQVL
ncbi:putative neutral ceramidase C [Xenopus laevis]|uniref:Neutral ceramidase n=2 Tax=Xenopus laevis TaxID=8355 RepID=A0A1L8FIR5_XENLA|nr:putative neutral ceramidase C [Xenopus laevis]OCT71455.1 hypothetical protein XELAEV_18034435mg [Xenopus laevis]